MQIAERLLNPRGEVFAQDAVLIVGVLFCDVNEAALPRSVLRRLAAIKVAQRVGLPLADIAQALNALPSGRTPTVAD